MKSTSKSNDNNNSVIEVVHKKLSSNESNQSPPLLSDTLLSDTTTTSTLIPLHMNNYHSNTTLIDESNITQENIIPSAKNIVLYVVTESCNDHEFGNNTLIPSLQSKGGMLPRRSVLKVIRRNKYTFRRPLIWLPLHKQHNRMHL